MPLGIRNVPLSQALELSYNRKPVPVPESTSSGPNPYFQLNLPPDYDSLSREGKRLARLNGVRLQGPDPRLFLRAFLLFDQLYLRSQPNGVFYKDPLPPAKAHLQAILDLASFQLNAWAYPRGTGKSTLLGTAVPLFMSLTRPRYDILMVLAKDDFVTDRFSRFMSMYEGNEDLIRDFGEVKPPRGAKVWNHHMLHLENGSKLVGIPVEGKMLGQRPDLILPDDPENDKPTVMSTDFSAMRASMERLLFGTIMPMLRQKSCLGWIGTLINMQSFLAHIMYAKDKKFEFWNRRVYGAYLRDGSLFWPEWRTGKELEQLRETWGEDYFQTHMMNNPGAGSSTGVTIHDDYGWYWLEGVTDEHQSRPLRSPAKLVAIKPVRVAGSDATDSELVSRPYGAAVSGMFRFLTIDWAFSTSETADFSCIQVWGYENNKDFSDTLWSLDLWLDKKPVQQVIDTALSLAYKWQVRVIGAEAVAAQQALAERLTYEWKQRYGDLDWRPVVVPIKPGSVSKDDKISAILWRFDRHRLRLPKDARNAWPYRELVHQITNFVAGGKRLRHDDAIDTVAMTQYITRPVSAGWGGPPEVESLCPVDRIMRGEYLDQRTKIPWARSLTPEEMTTDVVMALLNRKLESGPGSLDWIQG